MTIRRAFAAAATALVALATVAGAVFVLGGSGDSPGGAGGSGAEAAEGRQSPEFRASPPAPATKPGPLPRTPVPPGPLPPNIDSLDFQTLQALEDQGSDLSRPTDVIFYLYYEAEGDARTAGRELQAIGFRVRGSLSRGPHREWMVSASRRMLVNFRTIGDTNLLMQHLAKKYDGEYDGWEAKVQRGEPEETQ